MDSGGRRNSRAWSLGEEEGAQLGKMCVELPTFWVRAEHLSVPGKNWELVGSSTQVLTSLPSLVEPHHTVPASLELCVNQAGLPPVC